MMYRPPAFRDDDVESIRATMRATRLANLVTSTSTGLFATPLPLLLDDSESEYGVLYGHLAKANPQWRSEPQGDGLAIFMGPEAYVSPSWYATKEETGRVVPTWNYIAVQARGPIEFFHDADRLLNVATKLTNFHESRRSTPWSVDDAPADYVASQLQAIVGIRMVITQLTGARKMSQNRNEADREGVRKGLSTSERAEDRLVSTLIPD